jgi:DNA-directed RNA polymerase subunit RPC12/RpoP
VSGDTKGAGTYICAMCGEENEKGWSDEEAVSEMERYFGQVPESARVIICDDCYQKIKPSDHPEQVKAAIRELKGDA